MTKYLLFLFLSITFVFSKGFGAPNTVVLTADQVYGANDIEAAIDLATQNGTRSGTVLLDASDGPFSYSGEDRSINIYYSNITLRSQNGAQIINCADGIFFDDFATENVTIEGISFNCSGVGILVPWGEHEQVTLRDNTISSPTIGIILTQIQGNKVQGNSIMAGWQGILLTSGTNENQIIQNTIYGVQHSGISLEGDNFNNKIHGNKVFCAPDFDCLTVSASLEVLANNKISGNKP